MTEFNTFNNADYLMTVNRLSAGFNMPEAMVSRVVGGNEIAHGLPPNAPRRAFLVDEYPACPKDWLRSSGRIKSYFVPIVEGKGMWLDFNYCANTHTHHIAAIVSIQGVNAITGLPCKDAALEQYKDECPKHKKAFGPDRLCTECGFKWPKQNYLSTTAQPRTEMWLDGFRAEDGFIRQYVLTAQKMRGVAKALVGDDRVFALGISYFLSKEAKPAPTPMDTRGVYATKGGGTVLNFCSTSGDDGITYGASASNCTTSWGAGLTGASGPTGPSGDEGLIGSDGLDAPEMEKYSGGQPKRYLSADATGDVPPDMMRSLCDTSGSKGMTLGGSSKISAKSVMRSAKGSRMSASSKPRATASRAAVEVQKLEIGAGAKIRQRIYDDPNDLDFWQKEPDGLIVINYCTEADAEKIIEAGKIDLSGHPEGFLQKVPTGNP